MSETSSNSRRCWRKIPSPLSAGTAPLLALVMLCCIAAVRVSLQRIPGNPQAYHDAVRSAAAYMPLRIGSWIGSDEAVPQSAVTLLKPNVVVWRRFSDLSGRSAELMLVQCRDPRDLMGHYPPVCYPGQGWMNEAQARRQWQLNGRRFAAMEYTFSRGVGAGTARICVADVMLLPNNTTSPDMTGVTKLSKSRPLRPFGAAELQILVDAQLGQDERDAIYRELLDANSDVLCQILQGAKR